MADQAGISPGFSDDLDAGEQVDRRTVPTGKNLAPVTARAAYGALTVKAHDLGSTSHSVAIT